MTASALSLRVATPADSAAVSRVLSASYSTLYHGWYRDDVLARALPAMTRANPRLLASNRYFVVEIEAAVVSCGGWSVDVPRGDDRSPRGHIRHFATHPHYLNRGAAGAIIGRCIDEARSAGVRQMVCLSSLAAEAFYVRHGFDAIAPTTVSVGGCAFACIEMRRNL